MIEEDFDFEDESELEPQPLVPITANPLPMGPYTKKEPQKKTKMPALENYRKAYQKLLYFIEMPMSLERLNSLGPKVRAVASMFKDYSKDETLEWRKPEFIRFIQGRQHNPEQYKPLARLPGLEYPELSDQEFRQIFQSKLDPWSGPRKG